MVRANKTVAKTEQTVAKTEQTVAKAHDTARAEIAIRDVDAVTDHAAHGKLPPGVRTITDARCVDPAQGGQGQGQGVKPAGGAAP